MILERRVVEVASSQLMQYGIFIRVEHSVVKDEETSS